MKKILHIIFLGCLIMGIARVHGQDRYLDVVFDSVTVTNDQVYGTNISILPIILQQSADPLPVDLMMDIYEPAGDTVENRPVVLVTHRGDFLPPVINTDPYGTRKDSAVVELCKNFASRGFVAVGVETRKGWNPFNPIEIERVKGIFEASYRTAQDIRACVRYFRKSAAEDGNPYKVDPDRIATGGFDTGGFTALSVAYLKNFQQTEIPKFLDFNQSPPRSVIDSSLFGNPLGTDNRPLNIANHPSYSSDVSMVFAFEGGLGDFGWIEEGDAPAVGILTVEQYARDGIRDAVIGATGDLVIGDAAWTDTVIQQSFALGNNDVFAPLDDDITSLALQRSGGVAGMLLLDTPQREGQVVCGGDTVGYNLNNNPWNWYDETTFGLIWDNIPNQTVPAAEKICDLNRGVPNDPMLAKTYINDTIAPYLSRHIILAMRIPNTPLTSIQSQLKNEVKFLAYPNPVGDALNLRAESYFKAVELRDVHGRLVRSYSNIRMKEFQLKREELSSGIYVLQAHFDKGIVTEKVLFE